MEGGEEEEEEEEEVKDSKKVCLVLNFHFFLFFEHRIKISSFFSSFTRDVRKYKKDGRNESKSVDEEDEEGAVVVATEARTKKLRDARLVRLVFLPLFVLLKMHRRRRRRPDEQKLTFFRGGVGIRSRSPRGLGVRRHEVRVGGAQRARDSIIFV